MGDTEKLKKYLWDFFVIAQRDILQIAPNDLKKFNDFVDGKTQNPPFTKGSTSYNVCVLCEKIKEN